MANQITDNRTLVTSSNNAGQWAATSSATLDTEIFIEGNSSIGEQITTGVRFMLYNAGAAQNWSNNVFYIWINCGIVGLLQTKANAGFTIRFAGPSTTNWFEVYVGGSDDWPNAVAGGWVQFVVDIELARSTAITNGWTGGTPPATSAIQHVGYAAQTAGTMTRNTDNTWIDAIWRLPDGNPGIIVEGQSGGSTPWTFSDIFTQLTQSSGAFRAGPGGAWVCNTPIQIGINDATTHVFSDTNQLVLWDNQEYAPTDLYKFTAIGGAAGSTTVTLGVKTGTGDAATGAQGVTFQAASAGVRFDVDMDDANVNSVGLYGCTFIHGGDFQVDSSAVEMIGCSYIDCTSATINNSLQLRNQIIDANTADGVAFMLTDDLTDIRFCGFQFSDGHAVQITSNTVNPQTSKGNTFSGYGTTGTNDAAVYNNSGGALTINVTDLGDSPSYRNGTGASTTVNNAVSLTVTVQNEALTKLQDVRVAIYDSTNTQLMNELTDVNGVATESYNYLGDESISVRVRKSSVSSTRYIPVATTGTITSAGFSLTVTMQEDPNVI
jgi:hypothetical protein